MFVKELRLKQVSQQYYYEAFVCSPHICVTSWMPIERFFNNDAYNLFTIRFELPIFVWKFASFNGKWSTDDGNLFYNLYLSKVLLGTNSKSVQKSEPRCKNRLFIGW